MRFVLICSALVIASVRPCSAELIGVSWFGPVYRINEVTGNATIINALASIRMNSLARDSAGRLFSVGGTNSNQLININPKTGQIISSKQLPISDFRGMAFSPTDQLFATHTIDLVGPGFQTELMVIDVNTANVTSRGVLDLGVGGLTFSKDGTLYGILVQAAKATVTV